MKLKIILRSAFNSLARHTTRSLLTTLGIIIGITAIIAVLAIGEGAKYRIKKQIEGLGTNFILVLGGDSRYLSRRSGGAKLTLSYHDLNAIKNECEGISEIAPGIQSPTVSQYEGSNWATLIGGISHNYLSIRSWSMESGDFFTEQDQAIGSKVAVLGQTVKRELFGLSDPVGKTIRIAGSPFKVIGVLSERGRRPDGSDEDDIIMTPITTVQRKIKGIRTKFGAMIISAKSEDVIDKTAAQIRGILRQQHAISREKDDDFTLFTQNDIAQASDAAAMVLNILLLIIALISLIVGGIGIMNIMLVTVVERRKEIGIRLALGATTADIRSQFIFEAILICMMGGLVGVVLGVSIAYGIGYLLGWPIVIAPFSIVLSFGCSTLTGIFFGYYPAHQASMLHPVEALAER